MSDASHPTHAASQSTPESEPTRQRSVVDRRSGLQMPIDVERRQGGPDRRDAEAGAAETANSQAGGDTGLKRVRGPGRRRPEFNRAAEEGEFSSEQFLFVMAINAFKSANQKSFPTWTEVLEVIRRLGYRKVQPMAMNLPNADDWIEDPDAPAMPPSEPAEDGEDEEV